MKTDLQRRLTDAELRGARLAVADPHSYTGLTTARPDLSYPPVIEAEYHLPTTSKPVRCSYCGKRQQHWNGFVVRFRPSQIHLIGSDCGQAKLDLRFGLARRQHKELVDRQSYILRLDGIIAKEEELRAAIRAVLFSDALSEVDRVSRELNQYAAGAFVRLRAAELAERQLTEDVRVRDFEAERRRDEVSSRAAEGGPIYRFEAVGLGRVDGAAVLLSEGIRKDIHSLKKAIDELPVLFRQDTTAIPTARLRSVIIDLSKAETAARNAVSRITGAHRFFEQVNLSRLARWSASAGEEKLSGEGRNMVVEDRRGSRKLIAPIAPSIVPPIPDLGLGH